MANRSFNLTAELNVRGPSNLRVIAADIRRQLGNISVDINPRINTNANRNITNLTNSLATLNATLATTQSSANNAANAIRNFSQAINSVGTRNINQTLTNAATAAQTLGNNANTAGRNIGQAATQMEEFGRQSALAVRRFAAFSIVTTAIYGLVNAVNSGVKAFISFDKEFVRLQQVTGESAKGLSGLASEITRLSTNLGVSSESLTTVAVTLAQAGLSATETRKALQALARSALAPSFDDLNETVEGSIALMRQFGISADQLEGALGSVNSVAAKFAVEASDLIAAIQRTGGVFATASRGVSEGTDALNEFLAVFTSIRATTRESAETIATGLRTIFTRIQRESTITALQNLGIELRNAQGQFVGAFEAVKRLSEGLSRIDPRSREFAAISEELGGFRQIGKVIPLIQQFATAQQALKVAQTGQASLAEDTAVAQKSVANQIAKVREEFTALIRSIGESESFRSFVRLSLDLASALIKLADSAKTVLPALTAIAAFRGVSALTQFSRGFAGGVGGGRRFASGGYVPGSGNRDTVPAMLTPGEFVIRKKAVQSIGVSKLESMNKYAGGGRVQKLNAGGYSDEEWSKEMESIRRKYKLPSSSEIDSMSPAEKRAYEDRLGQIAFSSPSPGREKKAILAMKQRSARKSALGLFFSAAGMKRGPKAPAGMFEQTMAKYQGLGGMTSVKPKFIAWGKGQGTFGDVVRGSEDKIRSQLSGVSLSHFNSLLQAGTLQNYLASGGKQGHIPPLKKAIYSILGVTGKNAGGYIQRFGTGGEVSDPILANLISRLKGIGGPARAKEIAAQAGISFAGIPSMAFKQSTLKSGKVSKDNITKLVSLVSAVEQFSNSNTIAALAESKAPIERQVQGLSLRGPNPKLGSTTRRIGGKKVGITRKVADQGLAERFEAIVTARSKAMIAELSDLLDLEMKTKGIKSTFSKSQRNKMLETAMSTNVGNLIGDIFERALIATGAEIGPVGKGERRPIDLARLGPIAELFGLDPNQPTEVKRSMKKLSLGKKGLSGQIARFIKLQGFAQGGSIQDTVPALLTPGEFVINKKAASRIGSSRLHQLNRADKIQGFNKGGLVGHVQKFAVGGPMLPARAVDPGVIPDPSIPARELGETSKQVRELALRLMKLGASTKEALAEARNQVEQLSPAGQAISQRAQTKQQARIERKAAALGIDPTMTGSRRAAEARGDTGGQVGVTAATRQYAQQTYGVSNMQTASQNFAAKAAAVGPVASYQFNPQGIYSGMAKLTGALAQGSGSVSQFAASIKAAPLATFNASIKQAGTGLLQVGKMGIGAVGKGAGNLISRVGGGVLGAFGFGGGGGGRAAAGGGRAAAGGAMGGGGGMIGLVATMAGGAIVDSLSKSLGGETTESGRMVGSMGSQALNYGAIGATIGSVIPGLGTALGGLIGATAGLTVGFFEAQAAGEEYAKAQKQAASEAAMEKSGAAISKFAETGSATDRASAIRAFTEASSKEQAFGEATKRERRGWGGATLNALTLGMAGYQDENIGEFAKRQAATQKAGAAQAEQFLAASMMQSGKTFDELSKSMNPREFEMLAANIAEADETYAYFQAQRAEEIAKLRASGRNAEADALLAQTNTEQKAMAKTIAERKLKEAEAAAAATKAANASRALAIAMQTVALSLEQAFDAATQTLNAVSFNIESAVSNIDEMISGQASLVSRDGARTANILANPQAYSADERRSAMSRGAQIMGPMGAEAMRIAELAPQIRNEATRIAVGQQASGATNKEVGETIKDTLRRQIENTFGVGSPMAETAIRSMENNINKAIEEAGTGMLDVQSVVADAMSPITKVSEQAAKAIQQANEVVSQNLKALGEVAQKVAELEQKRISRTAALEGMRAQTADSVSEAIGIRLSSAQKARTRVTERASRVGIAPDSYGASALVQRRQDLLAQQEALKARVEQAEAAAPTSPRAARELLEFQTQLANVNNTLKDVDNQLEELPQTLQEQIGDVIGEIQSRVSQLEAKKEAGAGFAEKLITSTPQELQGMASTYNLLNNTLKGNVTTIQNSQVAQKAYFESLRQGKTAQEAMNDAQSAFAEENKKALSMFNELAQVTGIQGPEMDRMRADLIANFAKATGQQDNPFIRKAIEQLREDPAARAARDPELQARMAMLRDLQNEQTEATRKLNEENAKTQKGVIEDGSQPLIKALSSAGTAISNSVNRLAAATGTRGYSSGGVVYASKGKLINFQPKGTDTVPAMLTPGEFVVNRRATQKNLPLLKSINNGQSNGGNYALGGVVSNTPTLDQNTINRAVSNSISNFQNTLDNVDNNTTDTKKKIDKAVSNKSVVPFSRGGTVYASKGQLIGAKSKGTDTVPAMLTPGEFVVNRQATKNNLGLLQSINSGVGGYSRGGVVYLEDGGLTPEARQTLSALQTEGYNLEDIVSGKTRVIGINIKRIQSEDPLLPNKPAPNIETYRENPRLWNGFKDASGFWWHKRGESVISAYGPPPALPNFRERFQAFESVVSTFAGAGGVKTGQGLPDVRQLLAGMPMQRTVTGPLGSRVGIPAAIGRPNPGSVATKQQIVLDAIKDSGGNFYVSDIPPGVLTVKPPTISKKPPIPAMDQPGTSGSSNLDFPAMNRSGVLYDAIIKHASEKRYVDSKLLVKLMKNTVNEEGVAKTSAEFFNLLGLDPGSSLPYDLVLEWEKISALGQYVRQDGLNPNKVVFSPVDSFLKLFTRTNRTRTGTALHEINGHALIHGVGGTDRYVKTIMANSTRLKNFILENSDVFQNYDLSDMLGGGYYLTKHLLTPTEHESYTLRQKEWQKGGGEARIAKLANILANSSDNNSYQTNLQNLKREYEQAHRFIFAADSPYFERLMGSGYEEIYTQLAANLYRLNPEQSTMFSKLTAAIVGNVDLYDHSKILPRILAFQRKQKLPLVSPTKYYVRDRITKTFRGQAIDGQRVVQDTANSWINRYKDEWATNPDGPWTSMIDFPFDKYQQEPNPISLKSRGGMIYASKGQLINFQPKGTDTVPAMLTPGEFVVNREATQKNLPLLKSINNGAKGYSKGGVAYLQKGGLTDEVGTLMGNYYRNAIQKAAQEGRWFVTDKSTEFLLKPGNGTRESFGLAESIERINSIANVLSPNVRAAIVKAKDTYDWYDDKTNRVYPASLWYEKKFKNMIKDVKNKKKNYILYKEAYDREINKFPKLFEKPNPKINIPGNEKFFSEQPNFPDPKSDFIKIGIKDPKKSKTIWDLLYNRRNLLRLISDNNKEAGLTFFANMNTPEGQQLKLDKYVATAASQVKLANQEITNNIDPLIALLKAQTPTFQNLQKPPNKFTKSRLFDISDEAVDINYDNIISRPYNRGGVVYANKGKLINFQPKGTDTVPAMLTPGEFVVNKKASQQNAGLLNAINSGNYSSGGPVYLANGTPISYEERQKQRREAYQQQQEMRRTSYLARTGQLMTGAGPTQAPPQQRQQPAQANNFEIKISREAQEFLTTLSSKIDSFGKYVDNLANIKIPDKIELNITAQPIEVRITGAAAFENMSEGIKNMITSEVNSKMSEIWGQTGGEIGSRPA